MLLPPPVMLLLWMSKEVFAVAPELSPFRKRTRTWEVVAGQKREMPSTWVMAVLSSSTVPVEPADVQALDDWALALELRSSAAPTASAQNKTRNTETERR